MGERTTCRLTIISPSSPGVVRNPREITSFFLLLYQSLDQNRHVGLTCWISYRCRCKHCSHRDSVTARASTYLSEVKHTCKEQLHLRWLHNSSISASPHLHRYRILIRLFVVYLLWTSEWAKPVFPLVGCWKRTWDRKTWKQRTLMPCSWRGNLSCQHQRLMLIKWKLKDNELSWRVLNTNGRTVHYGKPYYTLRLWYKKN